MITAVAVMSIPMCGGAFSTICYQSQKKKKKKNQQNNKTLNLKFVGEGGGGTASIFAFQKFSKSLPPSRYNANIFKPICPSHQLLGH